MSSELVLKRILGWTAQDRCRCGAIGHQLLARAAARTAGVSEQDGPCPEAVRRLMHDQGLLVVTEAAQVGWKRGSWMATATPAGVSHHCVLIGTPDIHLPGCGAPVGDDGDCSRCRKPMSLTTQAAQRRLSHMPSGSQHNQEMWAAQFVCPFHGRCRSEMVTTKKTCAWCGHGLYRHVSLTVAD